MGTKITYDADCPELIAFCQRCTRPECDGLCDEYADRYRQIYGLPERVHARTDPKPRKQSKGAYVRRTYEAFGHVHTLQEWANIVGLSYQTLWSRLDRGMDIESALNPHRDHQPRHTYTFDGTTMGVTEWCRQCNVPRATFYTRLCSGMSIGQALGLEA